MNSQTARVFSASVDNPSSEITYPRYYTSCSVSALFRLQLQTWVSQIPGEMFWPCCSWNKNIIYHRKNSTVHSHWDLVCSQCMLDTIDPSLDFVDLYHPNIGCARFHGTFTLGFGVFIMLDTIHPSLHFVDLQCMLDIWSQYWVCQIPWYIHIGIWCVHNAGYYPPKSGFCWFTMHAGYMIPIILGVPDSMVQDWMVNACCWLTLDLPPSGRRHHI